MLDGSNGQSSKLRSQKAFEEGGREREVGNTTLMQETNPLNSTTKQGTFITIICILLLANANMQKTCRVSYS